MIHKADISAGSVDGKETSILLPGSGFQIPSSEPRAPQSVPEAGYAIAIVDDYAHAAEMIAAYIRRMGCSPSVYTNPLVFLDELKNTAFNIVITDLRMPQMDGISLLKKIRKQSPDTEVIVVSAHADKKAAIEALKQGAYDFFEKPVCGEELVATIKRTMGYQEVLRQRDALAQRISLVTEQEAKKWGIQAFVGNGPAMKETVNTVRLLQKSGKTTVLVLGESGTGKELVARAIHFGSARATAPFVAVNCSALPCDLAESILFGHIKGAFTGAISDRKGQFELAAGGTLFLDEIGDMPILVQTKLLRVLEDGIVIPVGKADGRRVDVRVISATNTDLKERIASGRFRLDLYHRVAAYEMVLPPLRKRPEDLPMLARHFVAMLSEEMGIPQPAISLDFLAALNEYPFPGNVRELRNILERAMIDSRGKELRTDHLSLTAVSRPEGHADGAPAPVAVTEALPVNLKELEAQAVQRAVDQAQGNMSAAARLLGIGRTKLYRMIAEGSSKP